MNQEKSIEQEEKLDLTELLYVIKKRILLVVLLPIICAGAATAVSFFLLQPVYQAQVSIIVSKAPDKALTPSDVVMYQDLMKTYTEIAGSSVVAERAVNDGNLNVSPEDLQSTLTVSNETGDQILRMSLNNGSPGKAVKQVEALAAAFVTESSRLLPSGTVNIMDHAKTPKDPIKPNKELNIIIAFAASLMAAVALAFLMEFMNDAIKSEEDVERYLGVPVLGVIPKHV